MCSSDLGRIGLANMDEWKQNRILANFFIIILSYLFIAMGVPIFLTFVYFMIKRHDSREYLSFCLQLCCVFFIIMDGCNYWNMYGSLLARFKILGLAWAGMIVLHHNFLQRFYELKREKLKRLFLLYFILCVVIGLFFVNEGNLRSIGLCFIGVSVALGVCNLVINTAMIIKRKNYIRFFTFFDIIGMMGALHDGIMYVIRFAGLEYPPYFPQWMVFHYTVALLVFAIAIVLVSRFYRVMGEMKHLASSVESVVFQNELLYQRLHVTHDSRRRAAPAAINDRADDRIEQVLNYIRENYTEDISREGLAAMVDIHPDTLGRFFKIYTNMRIGDYINILRIEAAVRKLVESDTNIITIAFDVGFDSLRTFNRVFRKIKKMTPEEYRKKNTRRDAIPVAFSANRAVVEES